MGRLDVAAKKKKRFLLLLIALQSSTTFSVILLHVASHLILLNLNMSIHLSEILK
jgi:hypothetical protein